MNRRIVVTTVKLMSASLALASVVAILAFGSGGVARRPASTPPSASPSDRTAAILAELSARGAHCVECYLLWDTNSGAYYVPPETAAPPGGEAWLGIELLTADGKTVRLSDFAGHPVLVELMSTWCASCADQQDTIRDSRMAFPAGTVIVSLDVDPASAPGTLAPYAASRGYDWVFAPSPVELSRALQAQFGDAVLNPAATPIVVIDPAGAASLAPLGHKDAAALVALLGGA